MDAMIKDGVEKRERLWNRNFFLLWQGQIVSALGDVFYNIALGFWVLKVTGSTALMGTLMAASVLPRVIISPFAGVVADRMDRKKIIILTDAIRGIVVVLVGLAAYMGIVQIWMVFIAAVILGICGAFFNPAAMSVVPDIVHKNNIIKANSVFNMAYTGTNIFGNVAGGSLYNLLGAPLMFLFNGISYLFSSFTEIFINVPKVKHTEEQMHFFTDMKEGFKFVWNFKGLRYIISLAAFLNFFANMAIILILPLFERTEWLGPGKYGQAMGVMAFGSLMGMLYTSIRNIKPEKRFFVFMLSAIISGVSFASFPFFNQFLVMLVLLFFAGFFNAIINVFFNSTIQLTVPQNMRGKVSGLLGLVLQGFTPISMAFGGVLAEFIPISIIISSSFIISTSLFIPLAFIQSFKRFINYDPDTQTLNDIM